MLPIRTTLAMALTGLLLFSSGAFGDDPHLAPAAKGVTESPSNHESANHEATGQESHAPPWGQNLPDEEPEPKGPWWHPHSWWHAPKWMEMEEEEERCPPKYWVSIDYMYGWVKSGNLPALVTTGLTTDPIPGAIGATFTKVAYGADPINYQDRAGMRVILGAAVNQTVSVEGSFWTLGGRQQRYDSSSPGTPIIARPFFNTLTNQQDTSLTTFPDLASGAIAISNTNYLQSEELNAFAELCRSETVRVRGLVGVRHLRLRETLDIRETTTIVDDPNAPLVKLNGLPPGGVIGVRDFFEATNNFYGGQIGIATDWQYKRFNTETFLKGALGDLQQRMDIGGSTSLFGNQLPGGLLALSSNFGSHRRDRLGVVPEIGLKVSGAINRHLSLYAGYSFLYFGQVLRPGSNVDLGVNPNLVPASPTFGGPGDPARPTFGYNQSNFWAHLFNFGFTISY